MKYRYTISVDFNCDEADAYRIAYAAACAASAKAKNLGAEQVIATAPEKLQTEIDSL